VHKGNKLGHKDLEKHVVRFLAGEDIQEQYPKQEQLPQQSFT